MKKQLPLLSEYNKYRALTFARYFGEFIYNSLLTVFLKDRGFSGAELGTLLSFSPFIVALTLPLWARIDRGMAKKILLLSSCAVIFVTQLLLYFSTSFTITAICMLLYSVARAPLAPSLDSMTAIYCLENKKEYSLIRSWGSAGYIFAIMVGSWMYDRADFMAITVVSTVSLGLFIFFLFSTKTLDTDKVKLSHSEENHDLKLLFTNKAFITFLILQLICAATLTAMNNYEILYLNFRGIPTRNFGITTLVRVSSEIAALFLLRKVKLSYKTLYLIAPFLVIPQIAVSFFELPTILIYFTMIPSGAASGFFIYLTNRYISIIVRRRNITAASYAQVMLQSVFTGLYLMAGGSVIDTMGITYIYLFAGCLFALSAIFVLIFFRKNPRPAFMDEEVAKKPAAVTAN